MSGNVNVLRSLRGGMTVLLTMLVAACGGGGGGGGNDDGGAVSNAAEGLYFGTTDGGQLLNGLVLENGEYYVLYGSATEIDGLVHGMATARDGLFRSSDARVFDFTDGTRSSATVSASYQARNTLWGTLASAGQTGSFSARYTPLFEQLVPLSALAGTYTGITDDSDIIHYALRSDGSIDGTVYDGSLSCSFRGSMTPRTGGRNVYNVSLRFLGGACAAGTSTATGHAVPVVQDGMTTLLTAALLPGRTDAVAAVATRLAGSGAPSAGGAPVSGGVPISTPGTGAPAGAPWAGIPPANTPAGPAPSPMPMTMACADGNGFQCSGSSVVRVENGITVTSSGVQVIGRSTSDLATSPPSRVSVSGLAILNGSGAAEVRVAKNDNDVRSAAILLRDLGISWDGLTERPPIIETFSPVQGTVLLTAGGLLARAALPPTSDLTFYNYVSFGRSASQAHYANNIYFPRTGNPSRCSPGIPSCPSTETTGLQVAPGDWRGGGLLPDWAGASRLHEDGDVRAGSGVGGSGEGVPFPGTKGYRTFDHWSLRYANLAAWLTQDAVLLEEWAGPGAEYNTNRRGIVTYGDVTAPAVVPVAGTATYVGLAFGWYAAAPSQDPELFVAVATTRVNFATRQALLSVQDAQTYSGAGVPVQANFTAALSLGADGSNVANYMTGTLGATSSGGIAARLFGPVTDAGSSAAPAELGGAFRFSANAENLTIGGFLGSLQ